MKKDMKINYHDEDYKSDVFNIIVYTFLIIFIICWWFLNGKSLEAGVIVFCGILILLVLILMCFSIKLYKKKKNQRNSNLFIMKNGSCIKGRITRIYDQYFRNGPNTGARRSHNVTAEVEYRQGDEQKNVVVDRLAINIKKLKQYYNKTVNIYVYNNMSYVDIVND